MQESTPNLLLTDKTILAAALIELRGARPASRCAKSAGIPPDTWRSWELRQSWPQPDQFSKILQGLGCTPEEFDLAVWAKMTRCLADRGIMAFGVSKAPEGQPETLRQALSAALKGYAALFHDAALQIQPVSTSDQDQNELAPWSYHQTEEIRRTFQLPNHTQALNFIVSVIEIAEESGLRIGFWLKDTLASITLEISEDGELETLQETLADIEKEAHNV